MLGIVRPSVRRSRRRESVSPRPGYCKQIQTVFKQSSAYGDIHPGMLPGMLAGMPLGVQVGDAIDDTC